MGDTNMHAGDNAKKKEKNKKKLSATLCLFCFVFYAASEFWHWYYYAIVCFLQTNTDVMISRVAVHEHRGDRERTRQGMAYQISRSASF